MSRHPGRGSLRLLALLWAAAQCGADQPQPAAAASQPSGHDDVLGHLLTLVDRAVRQATDPLAFELSSQRRLLNDIAGRLTGQDSRLDALESTLESQLDSLQSEFRSRLESLDPEQQSRLESLALGLESRLDSVNTRLDGLSAELASSKQCATPGPTIQPRDCSDLPVNSPTGVYQVLPGMGRSADPVDVFCDMDVDGGGWTVFQRRADILPHQDFFRNWTDYKNGFGELQGEFWWGLEKIWLMTAPLSRRFKLRVDLEDFDGERRYAVYQDFRISSETHGYRLTVGQYTGNAGNSLKNHNGKLFSTKDKDQDERDGSCAVLRRGAWWYANCFHAHLNGEYQRGKTADGVYGVVWETWKGYQYSLKSTEMKIRPM